MELALIALVLTLGQSTAPGGDAPLRTSREPLPPPYEELVLGLGPQVALNSTSSGGLAFRIGRSVRDGQLGPELGMTIAFGEFRDCAERCGWAPFAGLSINWFAGLRYHLPGVGALSPYVRAGAELSFVSHTRGRFGFGPSLRLGGGFRYLLSPGVHTGLESSVRVGGLLTHAGGFGHHTSVDLVPVITLTDCLFEPGQRCDVN